MGLPVTVYRSDDAGAPLLDGRPSSFIAVLKACLVDGYGAKPALGWTVPFEDTATQKAVFRNSTTEGSGGFVSIASKSGANNINDDVYLRAASAMSSIDSSTHPGLQRAIRLNTFESQWVLIGTSAGFYIQTIDERHSATNNRIGSYSQCTFIGDIHSFFLNDAGRFTIINGSNNSDDTTASYTDSLGTLSTNHSCNILYDMDGFNNYKLYQFNYSPSYIAVDGYGVPEEQGLDVLMYPLMLTAGTSQTSTDRNGTPYFRSTVTPYYRGMLPGFLVASTNGYYDIPWGINRNVAGVNHFGVVNPSGIQMWINTEVWYD